MQKETTFLLISHFEYLLKEKATTEDIARYKIYIFLSLQQIIQI